MAMISRERRERIKSGLVRYPALFRTLRATYITYAALQRELFALVRFAPRLIASALLSGASRRAWHRELPVQRPSRVDAGAVISTLNPQHVKAWCIARKLEFHEGGDAIYLPPDTWRAIPLGYLCDNYPTEAGLKLPKQPGNADQLYVTARTGRAVAQKLTFPHLLQTLTFNFLHLQNIAPRLYDLVEIQDGSGTKWTGYVVEHITPCALLPGDCERITGQLRAFERQKLIKLVSGARWGGVDFEPPDCNGNLLRDRNSGRPVYVDVHNFILDNYQDHLQRLAALVADQSHFGGKSFFLGDAAGSFLYQEIPGVRLPAKRSPLARMQAWDPLLAQAGISIEDKAVFDIGCNLGLMGAEYLRRGARWLQGWDQPHVVEAARKVLLSIGCTRFSLSGTVLNDSVDLLASAPDHLASIGRDRAIVSYLAVREHIGWLGGLRELPWRYMLYEGHQEDEALETYIAQLNERIPVRVLTADRMSDGISAPRDVAVIERLPR